MAGGSKDTGGPLLVPGRQEDDCGYCHCPDGRRRCGQRGRGTRAQAKRAEDAVGGVLGIAVRLVPGVSVMTGMSSVFVRRGDGLMRTTVVVEACPLLGNGHGRGSRDGQHAPQYLGPPGKQRRGDRRRNRAKQHRDQQSQRNTTGFQNGAHTSAGCYLPLVVPVKI